ncbi:MAG: ABC transporter permease subunit [Anaerolineae bacterium]|nr:ABC transporter permease subunit [Anaerolineae bacterium]
MPGAVFIKTLKDARRGIIGWGIVMAMLAAYIILLYPFLNEMEGIQQMLENLPPIFQGFLGEAKDMLTPNGYLSSYFFNYVSVILVAYGIIAGASAVAGEEKRGTMDLLMSAPVPRWRVILEKFAAFVAGLALVVAIMSVAVLGALAVTPTLSASIDRLILGMLNLMLLVISFGALTFLLSAALPSRFSAGQLAAVVLIAAYMLSAFAPMTDALDATQYINPFYYYGGTRVMLDGIQAVGVLVLVVVSAVFLALSVFSFERRDLSV